VFNEQLHLSAVQRSFNNQLFNAVLIKQLFVAALAIAV